MYLLESATESDVHGCILIRIYTFSQCCDFPFFFRGFFPLLARVADKFKHISTQVGRKENYKVCEVRSWRICVGRMVLRSRVNICPTIWFFHKTKITWRLEMSWKVLSKRRRFSLFEKFWGDAMRESFPNAPWAIVTPISIMTIHFWTAAPVCDWK